MASGEAGRLKANARTPAQRRRALRKAAATRSARARVVVVDSDMRLIKGTMPKSALMVAPH